MERPRRDPIATDPIQVSDKYRTFTRLFLLAKTEKTQVKYSARWNWEGIVYLYVAQQKNMDLKTPIDWMFFNKYYFVTNTHKKI